jgi:hypothetical protein
VKNPDFILCRKDSNGCWYRCKKCGTIEHFVPAVCPVCEGKGELRSKVDPIMLELFEALTAEEKEE